MSGNDDILRLLGELSELGMDVVRRVHKAVLAAEEPALLCQLTEAYCDAGRGVRQTIALVLRIRSGGFEAARFRAEADAEREELGDPQERPERCDWNEYERPDWDMPRLRLTGDPAQDEEIIRAAVETAVVRIRRRYAKAEALLGSTTRAALLAGTAAPPSSDSS